MFLIIEMFCLLILLFFVINFIHYAVWAMAGFEGPENAIFGISNHWIKISKQKKEATEATVKKPKEKKASTIVKNNKGQAVSIGIAIAAFLILCISFMTFGWVVIQPTEVGVQVDKAAGKVDPLPLGVGYHFFNRFLTDVAVYPIGARSFPPESMKSEGQTDQWNMSLKTIDGQGVNVDITIIYSLNANDVPKLHASVGPDYADQVLLPQIRSEARIAIGSYTSEQLYDGKIRDQIQAAIKTRLVDALSKYPAINIQDALMRDFSWQNPEFQRLIEAKKTAEQQVEVNKNLVAASLEQAQKQQADASGNKLQAVQEAEGRGESLKAEAEGNAAAIRINADADRYKLEQEAAGNLARFKAEAEGKKLAAEALGGGQYVVALKFAESLSPDLKIYAYPTGAPGTTTIMDATGVLKGMMPPQKQESSQ